MAKGAISLRLADFERGGLLNDIDVEFRNARFMLTDYGGKSERVAGVVSIDLHPTDGPAGPVDENAHPQFWSAFNPDHFIPDEADECRTLAKVGAKESLILDSNFYLLLKTLIEAGLPESAVADGDLRGLDGIRAHVSRRPAPKRSGLSQKDDATVLVVTKIHSLPGDQKPAAQGQTRRAPVVTQAQAQAQAPAQTNGAGAGAGTDLTDEQLEKVATALQTFLPAGKTKKLSLFRTGMQAPLATAGLGIPQRNAVSAILAGPGAGDWLGQIGFGLTEDGQTVMNLAG